MTSYGMWSTLLGAGVLGSPIAGLPMLLQSPFAMPPLPLNIEDLQAQAAVHIVQFRAELVRSVLEVSVAIPATDQADLSIDGFRRCGRSDILPPALLTRAWLRFLKRDADGARADLDEAWDIAERGPMRLHLADIHLHRARLFFREKSYPWKSPQDDLAVAEKLINDCGYHRRDEELADAKRAILGS